MEKSEQLILKRGYLVFAKGFYPYHRWVYRQHYGRAPRGWHVHHVDGDAMNNEPMNLIALPAKLHAKVHGLDALPSREQLELWVSRTHEQASHEQDVRERRKKKLKAREIKKKMKKLREKAKADRRQPNWQQNVRTSEEFTGVVKRYTPKGKLIT